MHQVPVTIITPCYNENVVTISFLNNLESVLQHIPLCFRIVVVNDGSSDNTRELLDLFRFAAPGMELEVIHLDVNMGHQAAIFQGFLHALRGNSQTFIVMDSDGEDTPSVIPQLLAHTGADIVSVVRRRRRESLLFRFCYRCYKTIFLLLTGRRMNFGNYCLVSRSVLEAAIASRFTHLAAFLSAQKGVKMYIKADREERLGGRSKMSFGKLLRHAVSSFTEYVHQRLRKLPGKTIFR